MAKKETAIELVNNGVEAADLSMIGLLAQADLVVQGVIVLLLAASFWSWVVIFDKWRRFKSVNKLMDRFERQYRASESLEVLYDKLQKRTDSIMGKMFVTGMRLLLYCKDRRKRDSRLAVKERIFHGVQHTKNHSIEVLEKDLVVLATVGSSAPFIGLFGTVWGIMHSFQSIAATKNTTLAVVAPGIAEALFATAIGLFAAIPAAIFYNVYSSRIRVFVSKLDDFCDELSSILSHQVIGK